MRRAAAVTAICLLALLPAGPASADSCVDLKANPNGGYVIQVCATDDDPCTQVYAKIDGQVGPFGALYTTGLPPCL